MPKYKEVEYGKQTGKGYEKVVYGINSYGWCWCLNGVRHRTNGHATEFSDGGKQWSLHGKVLDKNWFLANPKKINEMKAWELFTPEELVRLDKV